jgi:hypothetical protein
MSLLRWVLGIVLGAMALVLLVAGSLLAAIYWNGRDADPVHAGSSVQAQRPASTNLEHAERIRDAASDLAAASDKQILFGDLHVHTTFSADAFAFSLPVYQGAGARPPADACDFARFCSQLDFWSINDHAESLGEPEWRETVRSIAECNAAAGDPASPDLVSFLGWEWSHGTLNPDEHYGHKNVVLRDFEAGRVPARPVSAPRMPARLWSTIGSLQALGDLENWDEYSEMHAFAARQFGEPTCEADVEPRELPSDCREVAQTPDLLFEKLGQWGLPALVIPHGLAWGVTNPPHANAANQIGPPMHDPRWQRLIEVYSGHGNSEVFRDFTRARADESGGASCPEPTADFTDCCWRAGELVEQRCEDATSASCQSEILAARENVAGLSNLQRYLTGLTELVPGARIEDFADCDQLRQSFLPAYNYRPRMSAQYGVALGDFSVAEPPARWRLGFIAASDNHSARAGTGYKEFGRLETTEGLARSGAVPERHSSFYFTGGLTAVHTGGRDRGSLFDSLSRREVYGTSGDRILLWFDLLGEAGARYPMGSEVSGEGTPRFAVRAAGAFEQQPGCPSFVGERLTPERLSWLCMDECYHPAETRRRITRIEVVRIRPQASAGEPVPPLIEDPWLVLDCPGDPVGCSVSFADPEFAGAARETLYYVRAIQAPTLAVNGDPLRCERDTQGRCTRARLCDGTGTLDSPPTDDCLAPVEERAWSSPIWVTPASG